MTASVNKIRNADFAIGARQPRNWAWETDESTAQWSRPAAAESIDQSGVTIELGYDNGSAGWSQTVVCKRGEFYRIEATVSCDLNAKDTADGFVLSVQPIVDGQPVGAPSVTPGIHRSSSPIAVRAYYKTGEDVNRLRITIGVSNAIGWACIHDVQCLSIIEPEAESHPLAIPPPAFAVTAPRSVSRIDICSETAETRPVTTLLRSYFGKARVRAVAPRSFNGASARGDAILLPDAVPPPSIRSVAALVKIATRRIVIISLPAFAKLAKPNLSLRRVEQPDDPIFANVAYANYATRGFALNDKFPYAGSGVSPNGFVQNHYRRTGALKLFCEKYGFVTFLESMCNQDVTSERPTALYKEIEGGGLFVIDIEPAEMPLSTQSETTLAVHLLLSLLGQTSHGIGQYTAPDRSASDFREQIREMAVRFPQFIVHDDDVPTEDVSEQFVTIGREDETFGLPLTPKPVILVRSGLTSGDAESVHGAWTWFKQLLRPMPYPCPYAELLASQYRLAWVPTVSPWEAREGWRRKSLIPQTPMELETDGTPVAALIDIVSRPIRHPRVIVARNDANHHRLMSWLPRLLNAFGRGAFFAPLGQNGDDFSDRDCITWQRVRYDVEVVVDADRFDNPLCDMVRSASGQPMIIEVPGYDADFLAHSIHRTNLTATLLELVIGLQYGLIAVNRGTERVRFNGFPPVAPGKALVLDSRDPMLNIDASQVG